MFDIQIKDGSYISLIGRFSASNTGEAEQLLGSVTEDCTIDFKHLEYISSSGIGSIIRAYSRLMKEGHTITLINMNNHVKEVFRYAGLDKVFTIG